MLMEGAFLNVVFSMSTIFSGFFSVSVNVLKGSFPNYMF